MEINISESEFDYFTCTYIKSKKELCDVKKKIEEKILNQNDNELNHEAIDKDVKRYSKLLDDKKYELYYSKKFFVDGCCRKHGFKLFLLLLLSNYFAHFFPVLIVPVSTVTLCILLVDVLFLSNKYTNKYSKYYYESQEYECLKSDLDYLKKEYERSLNDLNKIQLDIISCEKEITNLNKRRSELENKIEELKNNFFNKVIGDDVELESPIELKRK